MSPATVLASWHKNPCHQLLLGWSLCEQQMLLELNAKGPLHSQEQVLDVMVLRLAWLLLDTTVGWEWKCWKMRETVDVIKNVMSNEAWWTADATLTGLGLINQHHSVFWWPCEDASKGWLNTKTNLWVETGLSVRLEHLHREPCNYFWFALLYLRAESSCTWFVLVFIAQRRIDCFLKQRQQDPMSILWHHVRRD